MHIEKFKDFEEKIKEARALTEKDPDKCNQYTKRGMSNEEHATHVLDFIEWLIDEIDYAKSATCHSCEMITGDVLPYLLKDDLHGNKNVPVRWCRECYHAHTQGLSGGCDTGARLEVEPIN